MLTFRLNWAHTTKSFPNISFKFHWISMKDRKTKNIQAIQISSTEKM